MAVYNDIIQSSTLALKNSNLSVFNILHDLYNIAAVKTEHYVLCEGCDVQFLFCFREMLIQLYSERSFCFVVV